jgi:hypothetical protein
LHVVVAYAVEREVLALAVVEPHVVEAVEAHSLGLLAVRVPGLLGVCLVRGKSAPYYASGIVLWELLDELAHGLHCLSGRCTVT